MKAQTRQALIAAFTFVLAALVSAPAEAYTIYLKDGSKIIADKKYEVVDGKALIVLQSGTTTSIDFAEIDVERTDRANRQDLGTALLLDDGRTTPLPGAGATPPRSPSLSDVIAERGRPSRRPADDGRTVPREPSLPVTAGGWIDLSALEREPHPNTELVAAAVEMMSGQGIEQATIWTGSAPDRPFVEVTVSSEVAVFRALLVAANALLQLGDAYGGEMRAIELLMVTPEGERGGQFTLTPNDARGLVGKEIGVREFFLARVEF